MEMELGKTVSLSEAIWLIIKGSGASKIEALKAIKEVKGKIFTDREMGEKEILPEYEVRHADTKER